MAAENEVTVRVPMNIALVKYWGKRDEQLILPLNDSISLTVDKLTAETTVRMVSGAEDHSVKINGERVELSSNKRYNTVFNEALRLLRKRNHEKKDSHVSCRFEVVSTTNFPVAAGLASSAAGFAAIALGIQRLLKLTDKQANRLARIGSGSACRSMYGGLVQWEKGQKADGSDCLARRIDTDTWPDLYCVIMVFNDSRKKIGSSEGMRRTAATSTLLKHRIESVVPERIEQIKKAYAAKDFKSLAEVIMADSNQFHALCLDTTPPIRYMNDASWILIDRVHSFNETEVRAAYTFDAGPNACVIVQKKDLMDLLDHVAEDIMFSPIDETYVQLEMKKRLQAKSHLRKVLCPKLIVSPMGGEPS